LVRPKHIIQSKKRRANIETCLLKSCLIGKICVKKEQSFYSISIKKELEHYVSCSVCNLCMYFHSSRRHTQLAQEVVQNVHEIRPILCARHKLAAKFSHRVKLKVSKFQKQHFLFSFEPKNEITLFDPF
jgi:hypothetical protein